MNHWKILNWLGLTSIEKVNQAVAHREQAQQKLKEKTAEAHDLLLKTHKLKKLLKQYERGDGEGKRLKLLKRCGKNVVAEGVYYGGCKHGKRGLLIRGVTIEGDLVANHLWINPSAVEGKLTEGDKVRIIGKIVKYGSQSYRVSGIKENYGFDKDVRVKRI